MSNLSLAIGGRTFTVACAPGEEAHVRELGRTIDRKIAAMGDNAGQGDSRMLLFAALLLADELHEIKAAGGATDDARNAGAEGGAAAIQRLGRIADRIEIIATRLEEGGRSA